MTPLGEKMFAQKTATDSTEIKLGVGVFVQDRDGRVLIEKRSDCEMWGLLGGRVDSGESLREAVIREIKEESGLDVVVEELVGIYSGPEERIVTYLDNGDVRHLVDIVLTARIVGSTELKLSSESVELRFFSLGELKVLDNIIPPARIPIVHYLEGKRGVFL